MLLLGPTSAGKTPLGELIQQRGLWGKTCLHFDFGESLRRIVEKDTPDAIVSRQDIDFLGDVLQSGALLEDEHFPIARRILQSFLADHDADSETCVVLNGLPRHVGQAKAVEPILRVETVVALECTLDTILRRIETNIGGDREQRTDDQTAAVRKKLAIFHERTKPLVQYFAQSGAQVETIEVTAEMTPDRVWELLEERR